MEKKFKVGDKFVPHRPKDTNEFPRWVDDMDEFDGKVLTVSFVNDLNNICTNETCFTFSPDWCEKVDQSAGTNEMVEEHISKTSKTIDWEQRRYEIAKEYLAAQINGVYAGNLEWSCYGVVKSAIEAADEMIKQLKQTTEIRIRY